MAREFFDVAFILPLDEEFRRFVDVFPVTRDDTVGAHYYAVVDSGAPDFKTVAILQDAMGKAAAQRATNVILDLFDVGIIIVVGIAGGISGDVALGDICVTGTIIDVLENAKIVSGKKNSNEIEFASIFLSTDQILSFSFKYASLGSDVRAIYEDWQLNQFYKAKSVIPNEFI